MSKIEQIRTTAFRLTDQHFGKVYVYRPGERFGNAWANLGQQWRPRRDTGDYRKLPYGGLATALRVLTGDFVALERRARDERAFVISRQPIALNDLRTAVGAWEANALDMPGSPISQVLDDLQVEEVDVAGCIHRRTGLCPNVEERWVWNVGIWEAAHRLAATPMRTDGRPIRWRLDSDAALLSWDDLVQSPKKNEAAMHKLTLHLITVPGVEDPVLSIQSGLVRLAPTWGAAQGARYAWAESSPTAPILRAHVRNRKDESDKWVTDWSDRAAEVLRGASLDPLPRTSVEPEPSSPLRTGYPKSPKMHPIGRGVGQWFHECVAHHARAALGETASPVSLYARMKPTRWSHRATRLPLGLDRDPGPLELRVLVVYADSTLRRRVRDALAKVLRDQAHERDEPGLRDLDSRLGEVEDGIDFRIGPIEVCFIRPHRADEYLRSRHAQHEIEKWADAWLPGAAPPSVTLAAIIETDVAARDNRRKPDSLADPKQTLRAHLARKGIATQFIASTSAPKANKRKPSEDADEFREHAAANAVSDLFRSAGFFLRPFPEFGCGSDTIVVGVYGVRLTGVTTGARASHVVNLVAVSLGSRLAWGYADGQGWIPVDQATTRFLASDHCQASGPDAKQLVERAIGALRGRFGERPVVLLFDALGCRQFWRCLADTSDAPLEPWMTQDRKAVVRIRAIPSETVRPAGDGEWTNRLSPARHTDFRLMSVSASDGQAPTYVLSGSAVMSRESSARKSTRLAADARSLGKDWHSLGVTELQVLTPGPWSEDDLLRQIALLCRVAPTWDRTLRWPSPLHLARAIVRDHPHGYFDEAEDEDVEDGKRDRFDLSGGRPAAA